MQIRELFQQRSRSRNAVEELALELGWGAVTAAHWAAYAAGIRTQFGWTPEQIEQLCFLRVTRFRWK